MTPGELEEIRRRNWDECADDSMDIATSDRDALLAHVDALQTQIDEMQDRSRRREANLNSSRRTAEHRHACDALTARHLLAEQQARGIELTAELRAGVGYFYNAKVAAVKESVALRAENERLTSERDALLAEIKANVDAIPCAVRVHEGDGPEDLAASLSVSVSKLVSERDAAREKVKQMRRSIYEARAFIHSTQQHGHALRWSAADVERLLELTRSALSEREVAS